MDAQKLLPEALAYSLEYKAVNHSMPIVQNLQL